MCGWASGNVIHGGGESRVGLEWRGEEEERRTERSNTMRRRLNGSQKHTQYAHPPCSVVAIVVPLRS
jgi:hypothetical protein